MDTPKILRMRGNGQQLQEIAALQIKYSNKKVGSHWGGTTSFISRKSGEGARFSWGKAEDVKLTPVERARAKIAAQIAAKEKSAKIRQVNQEVGGKLRVRNGVVRIGGKFAPLEIIEKIR